MTIYSCKTNTRFCNQSEIFVPWTWRRNLESLLWVILGLLFMAGVLKKYASLEQNPRRHQAQVQAPPGTVLIGQTEQQVNVPTFVTRQQLPDIRIQLAELDREFDESDYDALRALDADIAPNVSAMSEEDINALPVYKYQVQHHQHGQVLDCTTVDGYKLKCSVCMYHVQEAELIRRLPCSHEFHANCIFPWLRQRGTCPICKWTTGAEAK